MEAWLPYHFQSSSSSSKGSTMFSIVGRRASWARVSSAAYPVGRWERKRSDDHRRGTDWWLRDDSEPDSDSKPTREPAPVGALLWTGCLRPVRMVSPWEMTPCDYVMGKLSEML